MEIEYKTGKLRKACTEFAKGQREWGLPCAKKVYQRLNELRAAENLLDISQLPGTGFHSLHHDRNGQFAVSLTGNLRLVFKPLDNPVPLLPDGGVDLEKVSGTLIVEVVDYHGR